MGGFGATSNAALMAQIKEEQLKQALKNIKEGRSGDDNGPSRDSGGNTDALAGALDKLGKQLSARNGTNGADGASGEMGDNGERDFERQRTILGDRANQEMEMEKLKAKLNQDRRRESLSSAMASLGRFR